MYLRAVGKGMQQRKRRGDAVCMRLDAKIKLQRIGQASQNLPPESNATSDGQRAEEARPGIAKKGTLGVSPRGSIPRDRSTKAVKDSKPRKSDGSLAGQPSASPREHVKSEKGPPLLNDAGKSPFDEGCATMV